MPIKPKNYFENRKCCECGSSRTTQGFGSPRWHNHLCNKEYCSKWLCHKCYNKIQYKLPDSHTNLIKLMRQCRNRNFDITKEMCKGCIGVEIVANTLGLKNANIESDNFSSDVDIRGHPKYGNIEVKISTLRNGKWQFDIKESQKLKQKFDTVFLLCMDHNEPWEDIIRIYAIPFKEIIKNNFHINISDNYSKYLYGEFIIDHTSYNETYHKFDEKCPRYKVG